LQHWFGAYIGSPSDVVPTTVLEAQHSPPSQGPRNDGSICTHTEPDFVGGRHPSMWTPDGASGLVLPVPNSTLLPFSSVFWLLCPANAVDVSRAKAMIAIVVVNNVFFKVNFFASFDVRDFHQRLLYAVEQNLE
jgi:hypothetical protein